MAPGADRNALLSSIQKGTKLKKTTTNDRSAPIIGKQPTAGHGDNGSTPVTARPGGSGGPSSTAAAAPSVGGPAMGLGGLFAGGMPKLRSTGSRLISSNDDNRDDTSSSRGPIPSASKSAESVNGSGVARTNMTTNILKKPPEMLARAPPTSFPSSTNTGATGATNNRPPPPPPPSWTSPPAAPLQSSSRALPLGGEKKVSPSAPTAANVNSHQRGTSPERRRATAPAAPPPPPMAIAANGERPPLPSRPVGLTSRVQGLRLQESGEEKATTAPTRPRSSSAAEFAPRAPKATIKANWRFPAEGAIPRPGTHSGRVFVYPSGRERGTYINETAVEVNNDADDDSGDNRINDNNNGRLRAPLKQQPLQMNASQRPNVLSHPSLTSNRTLTTVMAGEVPEVGHTKVATKMNRGGEGILPFNAEGQIQGKLGKLETELEEAISQQDFETCLALKPRINKLKDMLELSQRGLAIDEAKIDAV